MANKKIFGLVPFIILNLLLIVFLAWFIKPNWTIGGDGFGYYSYFRSEFFDHDLDFKNEYLEFDRVWDNHGTERLTPLGKVANLYSVGPSILWSPFLLIAHYLPIGQYVNQANPYNLPGFGWPYNQAIFIATAVFLLLGLIFIYFSLKQYFSDKIAFLSATAIWLLSPLYFYLIYEPSMSHVLSFFAVAGMIFFYLRDGLNLKRKYFLVGLFLGLAVLIRWQNIVFMIIPILGLFFNEKRFLKEKIYSFIICLLTAAVVFIPQLLAWKYLYGSWLALPQGAGFFNLWPQNLLNFFFSGNHGLFFWHPLLLPAILVFILSFWKRDKKNWLFLLLALVAVIYINAAVTDWMGGRSFGARRMDGILAVFAIGLAIIFNWAQSARSRILKVIIFVIFIAGIGWNILLGINCARDTLPLDEKISINQLAGGQYQTFKQLTNIK